MAYPIDPIAELAAAKATMHFKAAQCDELRAENAKLRKSNDMLAKMLGDRTADCYKLRELVRDMWQSCPVYTADCYGCEHHVDDECKLYDRMRELGIEVNA